MAETGHIKNVERFQQMVTFYAGWGASYNPSNTVIDLTSMQGKLTSANAVMDATATAFAQLKNSQNDRENVYTGIRKRTTAMVNYYASAGTDENRIEDARSIKRKIDGKRAKAVVDDPSTPEDETANTNSVSQQSYTQLADHFNELLKLFSEDPLYAPNETHLTIATNQTLLDDMYAANTDVINNMVNWSINRGSRDEELYGDTTGLVDRALLSKKYVKATYGTDSMEFGQVKGLEFTRPK